jgi:hypothetical protein
MLNMSKIAYGVACLYTFFLTEATLELIFCFVNMHLAKLQC